jgi:hypothetical protein
MAEKRRQQAERLLVASEYDGMEKTVRGQGYLGARYLRGQGPMLAAAPLKKQ